MSILIASVIGDSFLSYKPSLQPTCQASPSRALLLHHSTSSVLFTSSAPGPSPPPKHDGTSRHLHHLVQLSNIQASLHVD